jgi:hypothetical protein
MWFEKKKKGRREILWEVEFGSRSANTYLNSGKRHDALRTLKECIGQTKLNLEIKTKICHCIWRTEEYLDTEESDKALQA